MMGKKQHRCSKKQREERRINNANIFNDGFVMGYNMGHAQGKQDAQKTIKINLDEKTTEEYIKLQRKAIMDHILCGNVDSVTLRTEWEKAVIQGANEIRILGE